MTHAPATPHPITRPSGGSAPPPRAVARRRHRRDVVGDLRTALARAAHLDLDLLGDGPVRTRAEADERVDALARELVARMRDAGWDEAAAPCAVTSVLAASVPEAEGVLLRAARARR
jgi:hypothetical protein